MAYGEKYRGQRLYTWEGFNVGDIVQDRRIPGVHFMLTYVNLNGGPGNHGNPDPVFGPTHPFFDMVRYYLRPRDKFPRDKFGRNIELTLGYGGGKVRFLDAGRPDLQKVGRMSAEEWNWMVLQWELRDPANRFLGD